MWKSLKEMVALSLSSSLFNFGSGRTKSLNFYLIFLMFSIIYSLYFYGLRLLFGNDNVVKYMMVDVVTMSEGEDCGA